MGVYTKLRLANFCETGGWQCRRRQLCSCQHVFDAFAVPFLFFVAVLVVLVVVAAVATYVVIVVAVMRT